MVACSDKSPFYGDAQGRSSYADARMGQGMAAGGYALVGGYAMPARGAAQLPPGGPGSCHVGNMPPDADKLYLYERFAPHGAIVSVKVLPVALPDAAWQGNADRRECTSTCVCADGAGFLQPSLCPRGRSQLSGIVCTNADACLLPCAGAAG